MCLNTLRQAIVTIIFEKTGAQDSRPIDETSRNNIWFEMTTEEVRVQFPE